MVLEHLQDRNGKANGRDPRAFDVLQEEGNNLENYFEQLKRGPLPEHVAIIMDGNGRWAKKRHRPRVDGHR